MSWAPNKVVFYVSLMERQYACWIQNDVSFETLLSLKSGLEFVHQEQRSAFFSLFFFFSLCI